MPKANRCGCPVAIPNTEEERVDGSEKIREKDNSSESQRVWGKTFFALEAGEEQRERKKEAFVPRIFII